jgi:uncharacterized Zn-finger protein
MYKDEDLWPVTCPRCGEQFHKPVGWLKKNHIMQCPGAGCGADLQYHPQTFMDALNKAMGAIFDFSGHLTPAEKDR